jgi:hypothetical protein
MCLSRSIRLFGGRFCLPSCVLIPSVSPWCFHFPYTHCSIVLNCPRICVRSMNRIALVASLCSFRIALRSSRPIPESSSRRRFRRFRHCVRMWATVCLPSLHSQMGLSNSGTLLRQRWHLICYRRLSIIGSLSH